MAATSSTARAIRALLVAPDPERAALLAGQLESPTWIHIVVERRASLDDALSHLARSDVDVVVAELGPDESARLDTVRSLRSAGDFPLVVVAERADPHLGVRAVEAGADDYVVKDADGTALTHSLRYAVARGQARRNLRGVVERNADAMVVVDTEGIVLYANHAAERLFGLDAAELCGELFGFQVTESSTAEIEIVRGGEVRIAEMRTNDLMWEGRPAYLTSIRDITDRKRAAEYEKQLIHADRLASIGQLAAGVAHEINNPATAIVANVGLLQHHAEILRSAHPRKHADPAERQRLDQMWAETLQVIAECDAGVHRITSIVRDLRAFARIDDDDVEPVDLNDLVQIASNMTFNEIRHRSRLVTDLDELPTIVGDRGKLSQVVVNLLINAAHAIEPGAAEQNRIEVMTRRRGDHLVLSVQDTGKGIPEYQRQRIFEPFFTTKSREQGTGLGLSICADTVRKHGGELTVTSEVGRGSRFEIALPLDTGLRVPEHVPYAGAPATTRRARVLLIDNDPPVRRAIRRMLQPHEVVEATGGREALDLLASDRDFDVLLCDLMMPDVDGAAIHEALTAERSPLVDRLVFITGGAFTPRAKTFLQKVQPTLLDKPMSHEDLRCIVQRFATRPDPSGSR